jgi:hypothetical protein
LAFDEKRLSEFKERIKALKDKASQTPETPCNLRHLPGGCLQSIAQASHSRWLDPRPRETKEVCNADLLDDCRLASRHIDNAILYGFKLTHIAGFDR